MKKWLIATISMMFALIINPIVAGEDEYRLPPGDFDPSKLPKIDLPIEQLQKAIEAQQERTTLAKSFVLSGRVLEVTSSDGSHLAIGQKLVLTEKMPKDPSEYNLAPVFPPGKVKNAGYEIKQTLIEPLYEGEIDVWDDCKGDYVTHSMFVYVAQRENAADKSSMPKKVRIKLNSAQTCAPAADGDPGAEHSHGGWAHAEQ